MLNVGVSELLALTGTALMAVVIFAPMPARAVATTSFAPPPAPPPLETWRPPRTEPELRTLDVPIRWPLLIDPRATECDAAARTALIEALAAVPGAWADAILRRALAEEVDPGVRAALERYAGGLA